MALPPDVQAQADAYGLEEREDGLTVPVAFFSADHTVSTSPAGGAAAGTFSNYASADDRAFELSLESLREAVRQIRGAGSIGYIRDATAQVGRLVGAAVWVTEDPPTATLRVCVWPPEQLFAAVADAIRTRIGALIHDGIRLDLRACHSHDAPLGPKLEHCVLHEDCREAARSGKIEMALDCWAERQTGRLLSFFARALDYCRGAIHTLLRRRGAARRQRRERP